MKLPSIILFALFLAVSPSERLSDILISGKVPSAEFLQGEWHYADNSYVFFKEPGDTPTKELADTNLELMTVRPDNCVLTFLDNRFCTFRVGKMKFKLVWSLNENTREFKASVAFFSIKGFLVQEEDRIMLIYSKPNLEMMMRFLCPASTHKYIKELSTAMDVTDGLTLGIEFCKEPNRL